MILHIYINISSLSDLSTNLKLKRKWRTVGLKVKVSSKTREVNQPYRN